MSLWQQSVFEKSLTRGIGGTLNIGYKASETLQLGLQYFGFATVANNNSNSTTNIYDYNSPNVGKMLSNGITDRKNSSNSLNFNVTKKFPNPNQKMTLDIDYFDLNTEKDNNFKSYKSNAVPANIGDEHVYNDNSQKINNISAKIDFEMPYQWANISFGGKISATKTDNNVDISKYDTSNQAHNLIYSQWDNFTYHENIQALYFSANKKFGTKWEGKIGLRAEFTQNKGYSKIENQTNKSNYIKLFPTAYLSYILNKENIFTINYGRRINKPSYSNLNPARWYLSLTSYEEGNPFLQPSYTNNFELSHTYKDLLTSSISFSNTQNGVGQLTIHDMKNDMQTFIRRNCYDYNNLSVSEYVHYNIFPWWSANAEASVFYTETKTYTKYLKPKYSGWDGYFSTTNNFVLNKSKTFLAKLTYEYNYPTIFNESKIEEYSNLGIGLKVLLSHKKLQIALNANNILGTDRLKTSNTTQGIYQSFQQYYDTQYVRLSLSYKFGNRNIAGSKRETSNEEEKERAK